LVIFINFEKKWHFISKKKFQFGYIFKWAIWMFHLHEVSWRIDISIDIVFWIIKCLLKLPTFLVKIDENDENAYLIYTDISSKNVFFWLLDLYQHGNFQKKTFWQFNLYQYENFPKKCFFGYWTHISLDLYQYGLGMLIFARVQYIRIIIYRCPPLPKILHIFKGICTKSRTEQRLRRALVRQS